jgi:dTDP-4-amino-4,6-dideoxygalactose transaminase
VVFARYPLLTEARAQFLERAPKGRVEFASWYSTPVHALTGAALEAAGYRPGSCPNAEGLTRRVLSLPTGAQVSEAQIERTACLFAAA